MGSEMGSGYNDFIVASIFHPTNLSCSNGASWSNFNEPISLAASLAFPSEPEGYLESLITATVSLLRLLLKIRSVPEQSVSSRFQIPRHTWNDTVYRIPS